MNSVRRQVIPRNNQRVIRRVRLTRPGFVRVPPTQQKQKQKSVKPKDYNDVIEDVVNSFVIALNRPIVLVVLLCVVAVVYTHHNHFHQGMIGQWVANNSNNPLAIWIRDNVSKFLGLLVFVPTVLDSPQKIQPLLFGTAFFWVLLVPEASIYEYVLQSIALHTYFRVKLQKTRLFIIIFVVFAYFAGFWTLPSHKT